MNMQPYNQPLNNNQDNEALEKVVDAGLATYPVMPLPQGFTTKVMASIVSEPVVEPKAPSPFTYLSRQNVFRLSGILYRSVLSLRGQIRVADVVIAAFFALAWCVIAVAFIWTDRLVSAMGMSITASGPIPWLVPVCAVMGGLLALGMLSLYFYLEQWDT